MNEQQRQAVERIEGRVSFLEAWAEAYKSKYPTQATERARSATDLRTLLALIERPTTCFECSTELQGPFCPKCNPVASVDVEEIADTIRQDCSIDIHFDITNADQVAQRILDRLSAPVRS